MERWNRLPKSERLPIKERAARFGRCILEQLARGSEFWVPEPTDLEQTDRGIKALEVYANKHEV